MAEATTEMEFVLMEHAALSSVGMVLLWIIALEAVLQHRLLEIAVMGIAGTEGVPMLHAALNLVGVVLLRIIAQRAIYQLALSVLRRLLRHQVYLYQLQVPVLKEPAEAAVVKMECADGTCYSEFSWCGTSANHCSGGLPSSNLTPAPTFITPRTPGAGSGGTCGNGILGNGICVDGTCCSEFDWRGTSSGDCSEGKFPTGPASTPLTPAPTQDISSGTCGRGSSGNGICVNITCCSKFGWCGTTVEHCAGGPPTGFFPEPPTGGGGGNDGGSGEGSLSMSDL